MAAELNHMHRERLRRTPETVLTNDKTSMIAEDTVQPLMLLEASETDWHGGLMATGAPRWQADALVELIRAYSTRTTSPVTPDLLHLLGRPGRTFRCYPADEFTPVYNQTIGAN